MGKVLSLRHLANSLVDTRSDLRFFEQSSDKLEAFCFALKPVVAEQLVGLMVEGVD